MCISCPQIPRIGRIWFKNGDAAFGVYMKKARESVPVVRPAL